MWFMQIWDAILDIFGGGFIRFLMLLTGQKTLF